MAWGRRQRDADGGALVGRRAAGLQHWPHASAALPSWISSAAAPPRPPTSHCGSPFEQQDVRLRPVQRVVHCGRAGGCTGGSSWVLGAPCCTCHLRAAPSTQLHTVHCPRRAHPSRATAARPVLATRAAREQRSAAGWAGAACRRRAAERAPTTAAKHPPLTAACSWAAAPRCAWAA